MRLSSTAFQDQQVLPTKFAYHTLSGGKNVSVPLAWYDAPPETQSFALSMIDPHPVANNWIHWLVVNIARDQTSLPEGASGTDQIRGAKELYNTYGALGYGGPEPPKGSGKHPYVFTLYALNIERVELSQNASLAAFQKAIESHVIARARLTGTYEQ